MVLKDNEIQKLITTFEDFITEKTCDALSTLLKEPIQYKVTMLKNNENSNEDIITSDEIRMCSVRLNGKGDLHIELLYTVKLNHAINIASKLLGTKVNEIDEMGTSALQEVANILTGSFFNALSENTGFRIDLSTPTFKEGELQELLTEPANDVKSQINDAVITDVSLCGKETRTEIHMIIIQHPEHAKKIIIPNEQKFEENTYKNSTNTNLLGGENALIDQLIGETSSDEKRSEENSEINSLIENTSGETNNGRK